MQPGIPVETLRVQHVRIAQQGGPRGHAHKGVLCKERADALRGAVQSRIMEAHLHHHRTHRNRPSVAPPDCCQAGSRISLGGIARKFSASTHATRRPAAVDSSQRISMRAWVAAGCSTRLWGAEDKWRTRVWMESNSMGFAPFCRSHVTTRSCLHSHTRTCSTQR